MSTLSSLCSRIFTCLSYLVLGLSFASGQSVRLTKLYVENFTTQSGAERLRNEVIAELNKHTSLVLVGNASQAQAVLDGGGEIWVKGYRSLNPKSGRFPSGGTPVYDGYLSVELKDSQGETFWSYLATPGASAVDISKDIAKQIARRVADAMELGEPASYANSTAQPSTLLKGAGATFPQPVYDKWFKNYHHENPNLEIQYAAVGSEAGIQQLVSGQVDFGATDSPEALHQHKGYLLLPSVIGAVVPIVNLPGISGDIALSPEALSQIFLGKITKWNDPLIKQSNRHVALPDLDIVVVHRSDGSGTSYAWTSYLSDTNPDWNATIGKSLSPKWPVGKGAVGNDGVAKTVKELGGSIGYVEFVYALQNHLSFARVMNRNGEYVGASLAGMEMAAREATKDSSDLQISIVNAPGAGAYPIASLTWLVIPQNPKASDKHQAIRAFLQWMLGPGQRQAAALGYLRLPKEIVEREQAALKTGE